MTGFWTVSNHLLLLHGWLAGTRCVSQMHFKPVISMQFQQTYWLYEGASLIIPDTTIIQLGEKEIIVHTTLNFYISWKVYYQTLPLYKTFYWVSLDQLCKTIWYHNMIQHGTSTYNTIQPHLLFKYNCFHFFRTRSQSTKVESELFPEYQKNKRGDICISPTIRDKRHTKIVWKPSDLIWS